MLVGLPVHDDELLAELAEHADGRAAAADDARLRPSAETERPRRARRAVERRRRPRATRSATAPSSATSQRPSTHACCAARAHGAGVGALAEQQAEGGHDHRLARAGLAGDGGEAGAERQASPRR